MESSSVFFLSPLLSSSSSSDDSFWAAFYLFSRGNISTMSSLIPLSYIIYLASNYSKLISLPSQVFPIDFKETISGNSLAIIYIMSCISESNKWDKSFLVNNSLKAVWSKSPAYSFNFFLIGIVLLNATTSSPSSLSSYVFSTLSLWLFC